MKLHICNECGKEFSTGYFYNHLKNIHNLNYSKTEFYDLYLRQSEQEGKCLICGTPTNFNTTSRIKIYI